MNSNAPQVRRRWVCTSVTARPCGKTHVLLCVCVRRLQHTHERTCGPISIHVCAFFMYICHQWEVKSHYETDAPQALCELYLIRLTETHQWVSAVPHKHTHSHSVYGNIAHFKTSNSYSHPVLVTKKSFCDSPKKEKRK